MKQRANPEPESRDLTVDDTMWHHFFDVAKARDAVIAGKLQAVGPPMRRLAAGEYGSGVRPEWGVGLQRMRRDAQRAAEATDLAEAARAVATVAGQCGACHRELNGGPNMQGQPQEHTPYGHEGLSATMQHLVWAADEMWLGITIPHEPAWIRGANILAGAEQTDEASELAATTAEPPAASAEIEHALAEIREIGARAVQVTEPTEQQALYADLIVRCGRCHSARHVAPRTVHER